MNFAQSVHIHHGAWKAIDGVQRNFDIQPEHVSSSVFSVALWNLLDTMSSLLQARPKSTVGTPEYIAPEVLSRREYDGKQKIISPRETRYIMLLGSEIRMFLLIWLTKSVCCVQRAHGQAVLFFRSPQRNSLGVRIRNTMKTSYPLSWIKSVAISEKKFIPDWTFAKARDLVRRRREGSQNSSAGVSPVRYHTSSRRPRVQDRLRYNDGNVFNRLSREERKRILSPSSSILRSSTSDTGHWKSRGKRRKTLEEDLAIPWTCEDVDPFTPQIRNFRSSRKTQMPNNVKTYDGTGDLEDHLKVFQASAQMKRWAMPTWYHMFNSTLIGAARVWFDELPPESIDSYNDLKAVFLAYFMQQKKHVKDPVEIHNIKQKYGETIEEFMERFKVETDDQSKRHNSERRSDFRNQPRDGRGLSKFTPLNRTPKEIFAAESEKFKPPPPMVTPADKRSSNKFYRVPPLSGNKGTEGPLVIEAEIGGHAVYRMYVDGGSSMEVLYEHCFNRL
ncbi:reverse transcriptase domain-containing protein [Tanacetum coccineum]